MRQFAVFLNGAFGVGKTTALDHVGDLLAGAGVGFCLMDVDWFHRCWPVAEGDPENVLTEAQNIAAVWNNYRRSGQRQLILSGVIENQGTRERYEEAVGMPVRSVRLEATPQVAAGRLEARYSCAQAESLTWHVDRHADLATRLAIADLDELVVDTDQLLPRQVAAQVVKHFGFVA